MDDGPAAAKELGGPGAATVSTLASRERGIRGGRLATLIALGGNGGAEGSEAKAAWIGVGESGAGASSAKRLEGSICSSAADGRLDLRLASTLMARGRSRGERRRKPSSTRRRLVRPVSGASPVGTSCRGSKRSSKVCATLDAGLTTFVRPSPGSLKPHSANFPLRPSLRILPPQQCRLVGHGLEC